MRAAFRLSLRSFLVSTVVSLAVSAPTDSKAEIASAAPATWEFHPAVTARIGYDDNLFLQDPAPLLPGVTNAVPARAGSWLTRASLALATTWRPSRDVQLNVAYSPEIVRHDAYTSEDHDNHRLDLNLRARAGRWSHQLDGNVHFVDGSDVSPTYGRAGGGPAIGGVGVRSRREQLNTKLAGRSSRNFGDALVRVSADMVANDYRTSHQNTGIVPGYANYLDRSEWSAGADVGRSIHPGFAWLAGFRGGEQHQSRLLGVAHDYDNTLARILVGLEGAPKENLSVRLLVGPDFRHYGGAVAPGFDRTRTTRYLEASASWTATPTDTFSFVAKDYLWLSAGGPCAYQHTAANLRWTRTFNTRWSAALAADVQVGDSRDYAPSPGNRLDWIYTATASVARNLSARTRLDFELTREWSDSAIAHTPGREFTRWFASLGVRSAF